MDPLDILKAAGPLVVAAVLLFGALQYRAAEAQRRAGQAWKEQVFWATQIAAIKADPSARLAMQMLDSDGRRVDLFPHEQDHKKRFWVVTHGELAQALRPHAVGERFEEVETRLRDIFDDFLDHFERLDHFVEKGLIDRKELTADLAPWFDSILATRLEDPDTCDPALLRYILQYDGTRRLLEAHAPGALSLPAYVAPPEGHRGWRIAREERKEREVRIEQADDAGA
jgi:hypothetical protein